MTISFFASAWGHGTISTNEGATYAIFRFDSGGIVTLLTDCTSDVASTDADGKLCVYDGGSNIVIKNRLAGTKALMIDIKYSTYQVP